MITTTPIAQVPRPRKASVPSRPTTPLRSVSRTSFRASQATPVTSNINGSAESGIDFPLDRLEPAFAELGDTMADLEANFMHLQLLNESIARFNENFAAFLYGLNMTAFCVDFPEAPISQSFNRHGSTTTQLENSPFRDMRRPIDDHPSATSSEAVADATFMTGDTSFVENPPMSTKSVKYGSNTRRGTTTRGTTRGGSSVRGRVPVAGVDENGRRITRLPARGSTSNSRGRAGYNR